MKQRGTCPPAIASLNAKYVLTPARNPALDDFELVYDKEIAIYKNPRFRERALIVFDHRVEPDQAALLEHVRDRAFDPGQMVWFDDHNQRRVLRNWIGRSSVRRPRRA
jgi:hypothetical protein